MKKVIGIFLCTILMISSLCGIGISGSVKDVTIQEPTNPLSSDWINLLIVPDSVFLLKEYDFFPFKNRIEFTVKNEGTINAEDVRISITIEYKDNVNKPPMETKYPAKLVYLPGSGAEESFNRPLFRSNGKDFLAALISYAGMQYVNITVDSDNRYPDDLNRLDNTFMFRVDYKDIFPKLARLENIILKYF